MIALIYFIHWLTKVWFVSYRLNDSCAPLVKLAWTVLWARCWSPCRTPWSCCSRSRCWSERGRSGPPSRRTQTFLCRSWWQSESPSSEPVGPDSRRAAHVIYSIKTQHTSALGPPQNCLHPSEALTQRAPLSACQISISTLMHTAPSSGRCRYIQIP